MQKPTHITATTLAASLLLNFNPVFSIFYLLTPFLAILPDADHWQDSISKKLSVKIWKTSIWLKIPWKHRWWSHTLYFPLIVIWIFMLIENWLWVSFQMWDFIVLWILIFSHPIADMFTVSWIRPLYIPDWIMSILKHIPILWSILKFISELKITIPLAVTGNKSEYRILFFLLIWLIISIINLFISWWVNTFLNWYIWFFNSWWNYALYAILISYFTLFFFLSKEMLWIKNNSIILFKFIFKIILLIFWAWILLFALYKFIPDTFEHKDYILLGGLILSVWILYYFFNKHMDKVLPVVVYTFISLLYFTLLGVFIKYHNKELPNINISVPTIEKPKIIDDIKNTINNDLEELKN